jgi:glutathione-specific gamma-glutamylcyclotransferase
MDWVFAYGSLMGDALLSRYPARPARLVGYHRAFTHESQKRWGQPAQPCPIVGLASGGECWGLAFQIPREERGQILRALERREGASERRCETVEVATPSGAVAARVWVSANGRGSDPGPDLAALEARLRAAHGIVGNGAEYVRTLVHALELHGLNDPLIDALWARLRD